ncbi:MAG: FtsX-like permease family protein, partial [Anaerolineales bacterium]|nr:FtsX-like permease family protein [Anaerolineales bacterium]
LAALLLRQRPQKAVLAGVGLAFVGLVLLSVPGGATTTAELLPAPGDALVALSGFFWALYAVLLARYSPRTAVLPFAALHVGLAALLSGLGWLAFEPLVLPQAEDTAVWLGEQPGFREVRIQVAENELDSDHITRVTNLVQDKIEASGSPVLLTLVPPPGQHPLNYVIQAMAIILGSLGFLALLLSGFLVVNTISSLMAQQTRQIGMMKAIGARTQAIAGMYIVTVLVFGVLTLFIALPLGAWGAYQLTAVLADFFNINVQSYAIPPQTLALEIGVALLVPIVASLFPIWSGTRITVREAMNDYGVGSHYGRGWFDQLLVNGGAKLRLSRPMLLSLRNTFRRKKRLFFTLVVLVLSGTIFMSVSSLQASLLNTVDQMLDYFAYDVAFQFERPYRIERLIRTAVDHPDVTAVEAWSFYNARLVHDDGTHSGNMIMFAPPPETQLVNP